MKTTLCEIFRAPQRFNGKMVQFRAQAAETGLQDDSCSAAGLSFEIVDGGQLSPPGEYTFIASPAELQHPEKLKWKRIRKPPPPLKFVHDTAFSQFQKYFYEWGSVAGIPCASCREFEVTMTVVGRFDYVDRELIAVRRDRNAKPDWYPTGFGHMHGSRCRLVLQSMSDVVAKRVDVWK